MVMALALVSLLVYGSMLVEARRAAKNERAQGASGGVEVAGDVYRIMRLAYPGAFLFMVVEGAWRGAVTPMVFVPGLLLFTAGKALKWWAILSLGPFWTFRVIVIPGAPLVARGPYRVIRHPNYVGVAGELIGVALMTGAWIAGPLATIGFCALMRRRVEVEDRALQAAGAPTPAGHDSRRKSS